MQLCYYICYKVLKIQICFKEAEPTLEFNDSVFIITAALLFKLPRCHSCSRIASSGNSQQGRSYKYQHYTVNMAFAVCVDNLSESKQLIRHEA